ncbi:MAG: hypothetical protein EAZ36_07750, partial [Verrucomicrobia bacterium]
MRLPTQILLLGAILTNGARANETAPQVPATPDAPAPAPAAEPVVRLDPVIVTADIWETPLEKISASVSVYDGAELAGDGVRIRIVGDREAVSEKLRKAWDHAEEITKHNTRINLSVAFNYGGR